MFALSWPGGEVEVGGGLHASGRSMLRPYDLVNGHAQEVETEVADKDTEKRAVGSRLGPLMHNALRTAF